MKFGGLHQLARKALDVVSLGAIRRLVRRWRVITLVVGPGAGVRFCPGHSQERHGGGSNELPVQRALASLLQPGDVFADVGANVGFLTVIGAHLVGPQGRVFAFEPVPDNSAMLRRNLRLNGMQKTVVVLETALSSVPGRETLVLARDCGGAALSVADRPPDAIGSLDISVTTLDDLVRRGVVSPPRVVKIDVEGAEIHVLRGMAGVLATHRPSIIFEVDGPDESAVGSKANHCRAFLEEHRYYVTQLEDSYPDNRWRVRHYLARPQIEPADVVTRQHGANRSVDGARRWQA